MPLPEELRCLCELRVHQRARVGAVRRDERNDERFAAQRCERKRAAVLIDQGRSFRARTRRGERDSSRNKSCYRARRYATEHWMEH